MSSCRRRPLRGLDWNWRRRRRLWTPWRRASSRRWSRRARRWREGRPIRTRFADIPLRAGDGLLIQGPRKAVTTLGSERDLIVFDAESPWPDREDRRTYALLAVAALIVLTLAGG